MAGWVRIKGGTWERWSKKEDRAGLWVHVQVYLKSNIFELEILL